MIDDHDSYVRDRSRELDLEDVIDLKTTMIVQICDKLFDDDCEPRHVDRSDPGPFREIARSVRGDVDRCWSRDGDTKRIRN